MSFSLQVFPSNDLEQQGDYLKQFLDNNNPLNKKRSAVYSEIGKKFNEFYGKELMERIKDRDYDLSCPNTQHVISFMGWFGALGVFGIILLAGMGATRISLYSIPAVAVVGGGIGIPVAFKVDSYMQNKFNHEILGENDVKNLEKAVKRTIGYAYLDGVVKNDPRGGELKDMAESLGITVCQDQKNNNAYILTGVYDYPLVRYKG